MSWPGGAYNRVLNFGSPPDPRRRCSKFLHLNWWKGHCYHYNIRFFNNGVQGGGRGHRVGDGDPGWGTGTQGGGRGPRVGDGDPSFPVHPRCPSKIGFTVHWLYTVKTHLQGTPLHPKRKCPFITGSQMGSWNIPWSQGVLSSEYPLQTSFTA